jgi:GNAT superfamily N-acetyltransferase
MANTDTGDWAGLTCRTLSSGDIAGACTLSNEARWNQTPQDWAHMIEVGTGWGLFDRDGVIRASALTLPQPAAGFGWVSMVLVTENWRRKGLATRLLDRSIRSLRDRNLTPGLDATEFGRPVYLPLGFRDIYSLTRYERGDEAVVSSTTSKAVALNGRDLDLVAKLDRAAFGADRRPLLAHLLARAPGLAWRVPGAGHCLGRDGENACQIGPVVASNDDTAIDLVKAALGKLNGTVFIDAADHHAGFCDWLKSHGFRRQRGFVRMLHERDKPFDDPARIFAIAGPELG